LMKWWQLQQQQQQWQQQQQQHDVASSLAAACWPMTDDLLLCLCYLAGPAGVLCRCWARLVCQ
jgi:hypothetical protein